MIGVGAYVTCLYLDQSFQSTILPRVRRCSTQSFKLRIRLESALEIYFYTVGKVKHIYCETYILARPNGLRNK